MTQAARLTSALRDQLARVERAYLPELVGEYENAIQTIATDASKQFALTAAATPDWQPPVEGAIITTAEVLAVAKKLNGRLEPVWEQIVVDTAQAPLARIEIDWTVKHPLAENLLNQAGRRTGTRLGEAVQFTLRETLAHAYDNGLNVRDTSALIQQKIAGAAPYQADMLARTDLNSLANGASHAAARLAGAGFKTWLATFDDRTRIEHAEADGQTVGINETFTVGGEEADYPGDPALSDAMACNCRCTIIYADSLDEAGGLTAAGLRPSEERGIMRGMATKAQQRRRYERRAAHAQGKVTPTPPVTPSYTTDPVVFTTSANLDETVEYVALTAAPRAIRFDGTAAIEGQIADDNSLTPRVLLPDSLSWPEMPVSFMAQTVTAEGHDGAEVAGRVDEFARKKGMGKKRDVYMSGELTTPFGINEIAPMIEDQTMRYISADLGATEWAIVGRDDLAEIPMDSLSLEDLQAGKYALGLTSGKMKAVTLLPTQALEGATVALTASADDGTATITFPVVLTTSQTPALVATWDSCHASFLPQCVPPPKSPSNYARFHTGYIDLEDGGEITVGKLMFSPTDGGHADRRLSAAKASAYYDKTGMAAAFLRASDGQHGVWVAGALNPSLSDAQREEMRRELRLNPPSGDWRVYDGQYDLLCGLAVAIPGFGVIPSAEVSIVASADGVELRDAIIASSGWFEPDAAAVTAMEHLGLVDEEMLADRRIQTLAARAQGLDALADLIK